MKRYEVIKIKTEKTKIGKRTTYGKDKLSQEMNF